MSELSIGINSQGVNNYKQIQNGNPQITEQEAKQEQTKAPAKTQVNDVDTFAYMGNNPAAIAAMANINFVSQPNKNVGNAIADTIFNDVLASQVAWEALLATATEKLSPEQIASIEAHMGKFQEGVVSYVPLVEEELGATASEPTVLAVAAGMLLKDNE